jgi:hypothetical protein
VNHPPSVTTSDQPPPTSVNFSPFTPAVPLRTSDISSVPSPNLQPNPRGGTAKKIMISPYKKICWGNSEKKIQQATKSKTKYLVSNALLGPSKRRKRRSCRDLTPSDTPSDSDTDLMFLSLTIRRKKRYITLIVCNALVVFLKTTMEKSGYDVRNISDGRTHFVLVWRKLLFVILVRDKLAYCFVYILCICNFFIFVTILCAFCANYSPPQIRKNVCT